MHEFVNDRKFPEPVLKTGGFFHTHMIHRPLPLYMERMGAI